MSDQIHSFTVGTFACWTLVDSAFQPPSDYLYTNAPPTELTAALDECGCKALGIDVHVNNLLIRTPDGVVLVDTGQGVYSDPAGQLVPNMDAAGFSPWASTFMLRPVTRSDARSYGSLVCRRLAGSHR